jgi:hypothetical protein
MSWRLGGILYVMEIGGYTICPRRVIVIDILYHDMIL